MEKDIKIKGGYGEFYVSAADEACV